MKLLPLEALLEQGCAELGVEFGRRVYGEEMVDAAQVDDVLNEESREEHDRKMIEASYFGRDEMWAVMLNSQLTGNQRRVPLDPDAALPFFERASQPYKGWVVKYEVYTLDDRADYGAVADSVVESGGPFISFVLFEHDGKPQLSLDINGDLEHTNKVDLCDFLFENLTPQDDEWGVIIPKAAAILRLRELKGRDYNPAEVYQAVMDFLKM